MFSYYKYYLEIKNRGLLLFISWLSIIGVCYLYKEIILFIFINSSNYFNLSKTKPYFIFTNVSEIFYVYLDLLLFITNQITLLMFFYHMFIFLSLGLYKSEFKKLKLTFQTFLIVWVISIFLLCKFVIPYSWAFFLSFQQNNKTDKLISFFFEAKIIEYFNYFTDLYYLCLINCQFFALLTLVLTTFTKKKIKTLRKIFYFIFILFSTLMTPPDIISQLILTLILILIYEILIFINYLFSKVTN